MRQREDFRYLTQASGWREILLSKSGNTGKEANLAWKINDL